MSSDLKDPREKKGIGFRYAWNGLLEVCRTEKNFRIHVFAAIIVVLTAVWLNVSWVEGAILTLTVTTVMAAEMMNSSIERIMDHLAPERHPLTGIIKDIAAGAVLILSIGAVLIGLMIFLPKIL